MKSSKVDINIINGITNIQANPILSNSNPIPDNKIDDPENQEYKEMFQNLQGNILKGHGRDYSVNIFFSFLKKGEDLRPVLNELAERVTSAYDQVIETQQYNRFKIPGSMFGNLFLSANGYRKLGYSDKQLQEWFIDPNEKVKPKDKPAFPQNSNFLGGMISAAADFGDLPSNGIHLDDLAPELQEKLSPLQKYSFDPDNNNALLEPLEKAYLANNIDAMLLLADDDEDHLLREARKLINRLEKVDKTAIVLAVEVGKALRNNDGEGIEHFGYVDGRSQPLFLASDFKKLTDSGEIDINESTEKINEKALKKESGDISIWNPFAPLNLVLVPDNGSNKSNCYGSYFVFRKLEQDVLRFSMAEQQLADKLKLEGSERERAGAMMVGRFRDGTPLAISETDGYIPAKSNNFRYDGLDANSKNFDSVRDDSFGLKCPFQSHIRKTNPRQAFKADDIIEEVKKNPKKLDENEREDLTRRIIRRGITYGDRNRAPNAFQALDDMPTGGVGLLFACFQSSIVKQFAFMQKTWANNIDFKVQANKKVNQDDSATPSTGLDPLIGQSLNLSDNKANPPQRWRKEYGGSLQSVPESLSKFDLGLGHTTEFRISDFIKFRGGEFFFAPSIPFLKGEAKSNSVQIDN